MTPPVTPAPLLRFLKQPDSYPHKPAHVEHIQTHISHVFIVTPYVYKIKKPVALGFLDFSTLSKRKFYCEREVELNRRLCDGLYLGVIPVYRRDDLFSFEPGEEGTPAEYAVKMKQLDPDRFLSGIIKEAPLSREYLNRVAGKLAAFYDNQSPGPEILQWGEPEKIRVNTDENFEQTRPFISNTIGEIAYKTIKLFTYRFLDDGKALFERRIQEQRMVDGHGDLHLEHIHITGDSVCIYDCIEFNDRFRYQDLAADLAYLAMDLDFNDLWPQSDYFIKEMAGKLNDPGLTGIIDFYKCYRAYVRGKVKSIESSEEEISKTGRRRAAQAASNYFRLALHYALLGSKPAILIFMGRVASGKSTLAGRLSKRLDLSYYASDVIRKKLAGLPPGERPPPSERSELYAPEMSARTYSRLYEQVKQTVRKKKSVVMDATFSNRDYRNKWISQLELPGVSYYFIETTAPDEIRKKRLKEREQQQGILSDARLEDLEKLDRRYDPPREIGPDHLIRINTARSPQYSLEQLYGKLTEKHLRQILEH